MRNYIIFSISFFLSFINFMIFYSYPFRLEELGVDNNMAGLIVGTATLFTLTMRIVFGIIIDRFRLRWAMFITAILYCSALLMINTDREWSVISGRLALGALLGCMSTLLMYYSIIKSENGAEKSRNISLITFFNVLPTCLAPYIALKLTHIWGGNSVAQLAFFLFVVCLILTFALDLQTRSVGGATQTKQVTSVNDMKGLMSDHDLRTAVLVLTLVYVISGTTVTFLPSYLINTGMVDPAPYFLIFTVCMVLPRLFLKRYMPNSSQFPMVLLSGCTVFAVAGTLCNYLLAGDRYWYFTGAVLCGTTLGIIYPAVMSYVVCNVTENLSGTSSSLVAAAADTGVIIANLALGAAGMAFGLKTAMLLPVLASCSALFLLAVRATARSMVKRENSV